jgi:hypothetical protein
MKHNVNEYIELLVDIFGKKQSLKGDDLLQKIVEVKNISVDEARKVLTYCKNKKLVECRHLYSFYFEYSLTAYAKKICIN